MTLTTAMMNRLSAFGRSQAYRMSRVTAISPVSKLRYVSSDSKDGIYNKIAFCGTGKMAQAMLDPLIRGGLQPASKITIYDVSTSTMEKLVNKHEGLQTADNLSELSRDADLLVCAVKPQNLDREFFDQLQPGPETTVLSVAAGKPMKAFLDGGFTKVARSMPNTPAQIGKGMTVWTSTKNIGNEERTKIKKVLGSFGKAIFVDDESFIDMSTSISGSGPAYIFMLMEAMVDAGVHMGFSRDTATTLVHHTLLGSTLYAMETGEHPAILRNSVTSPAGTTASALYELENGKFRTVIKDAIWACYRRSLEMGGHDSNVGPGRNTNEIPVKVHHFREAPRGEMNVDDNDSDDTDSESDENDDNSNNKTKG